MPVTPIAAHARLDGAPVEARAAALLLDSPSAATLAGAGWSLAAVDPSSLARRSSADGRAFAIALSGRPEPGPGASEAGRNDADRLLEHFARSGDGAFDPLEGSWAAIVVEEPGPVVHLLRDPLGNRSLFLRRDGPALRVAGRAATLLARGAEVELDPGSIARWLAGGGPVPGATFFRGVEELPAGAIARFDRDGARARRVALLAGATPGSEAEGRARLLELLDRAVEARLPDHGRTAVLMSGGLDSTAVAAAAAARLAARGAPPPITISWVFDRFPGSDERRWIEAANRHLGADARLVPGDELHPLAEPDLPPSADAPVRGPYGELRRRALEIARAEGASVLLVGEGGDDLWARSDDWLLDLVRAGRVGGATAGLAHAAFDEIAGRRRGPSLRGSLARLLRGTPAPPSARPAPAWLTAPARAAHEAAVEAVDPLWRPFRAAGHGMVEPLELALLRNAERENAACGVEIRRPFRDRALVEAMLGFPAHWLYRPGETKRLLRRALTGRLPREVLERRQATSLLPLFDHGLAGRGAPVLRERLARPEAIWPRFVDRLWLESEAMSVFGSPRDTLERLVLWNCWCLETWCSMRRARLARGTDLRITSVLPEAEP